MGKRKEYFISCIVVPVFLILGLVDSTHAVDLKVSGQARFRMEGHKNTSNLNKGIRDTRGFVLSRVRMNFGLDITPNTYAFIQPQFSKTWGSVAGQTGASGGTVDPIYNIHQAYLRYKLTNYFTSTIGRQGIKYGDELLISVLGWSNVGRAFDAIRFRYEYRIGWTEWFWSKITESNPTTTPAGDGDRDFFSWYNSWGLGNAFKNVDLYVFYDQDRTSDPNPKNLVTVGTRLKSKIGRFDYRAEATFQGGTFVTSAGSKENASNYQYDVEAGLTLHKGTKTRLSGNYLQASRNFDHLFPLAHAYLGIMDLFSRKNIKGYNFGIGTAPGRWAFKLKYHLFQRTDVGSPAWKFSGVTPSSTWGTAGDSNSIGTEVDLIVKYKAGDSTTVVAGGGIFLPGQYMKDQAALGDNSARFFYLQLATKF